MLHLQIHLQSDHPSPRLEASPGLPGPTLLPQHCTPRRLGNGSRRFGRDGRHEDPPYDYHKAMGYCISSSQPVLAGVGG